jgi:hypothetical protein
MAPRRNAPIAPDPLAVALAAAVRWTSSDARSALIGRRAQAAATSPEHKRSATLAADSDEPVGGPAHETPPRETPALELPARKMPARDAPARATPSVRAESVVTAPRERSAPAPAAEPATRVHIGSIEVHMLPAPEAVAQKISRPQAVSSAAPAAPLARGLTSSIGLRQS